jgi:hypothetical protein
MDRKTLGAQRVTNRVSLHATPPRRPPSSGNADILAQHQISRPAGLMQTAKISKLKFTFQMRNFSLSQFVKPHVIHKWARSFKAFLEAAGTLSSHESCNGFGSAQCVVAAQQRCGSSRFPSPAVRDPAVHV